MGKTDFFKCCLAELGLFLIFEKNVYKEQLINSAR